MPVCNGYFRYPPPPSKPTVLLDSNVWRYLVDGDSIEFVRREARDAGVLLVAAPAVGFEALRDQDPARRLAMARALSRRAWFRPMPEVFCAAGELLTEITRHRSDWLVPRPEIATWLRLRADWQESWWRRVRHDTKGEASRIEQLGHERLQVARQQTKQAQVEAVTAGERLEGLDLSRFFVVPAGALPGWDGQPFEAWRAEGLDTWWNYFVMSTSGPYHDWLNPWVDTRRVREDDASWTTFWTREVEATAMPRHWVRWAMGEAQIRRRWSQGTPVDNQLTPYLLDVDLFVSCDKAFVDCLDAIRGVSPCTLAPSARLRSGVDCAEDLARVLRRGVASRLATQSS